METERSGRNTFVSFDVKQMYSCINKMNERSWHTLELNQILDLLVEQCNTERGKELAAKIVPTADIDDVAELLQETNDACSMVEQHGNIPIQSVRDPGSALLRADRGGSLNTKELLDIGRVLRVIRETKAYGGDASETENGILPYFSMLVPNQFLEKRIETVIPAPDEISDQASPALADIRRHIRISENRVRESLQKVLTSATYSKFLREQIITMRNGRYVVPVRSEYKNSIPGMVHDVSSSGSTFFVEPMQAVQANNDLQELQIQERKEIERILAELSAQVAEHREDIESSCGILFKLDVIFAKAKLSFKMKAMRPELNECGKIVLNRARHPLIESSKVVPVTVNLGDTFDTLVITGPNTGGKTVTLKTIGLLTLMTECGLNIPVSDGSIVSTFQNVYADIGDEQSITQSLSTFSSHMRNIVEITDTCDDRTLVLFDELGAGTDPAEGAALAIAVIEWCRKLGSKVCATTHYGELKLYAMRTEQVMNASCEFDVESLKPTYRLMIGVPGKSNAFSISRRLGLDELIIDKARSLQNENDVNFEEVLTQLESQRQAMEAAREEAEHLKNEMQQAKQQSEAYEREIQKEREKAIAQAKKEAQTIIEDARTAVNLSMEELKQLRRQIASSATADDFNRIQSEIRRNLNDAERELSAGAEAEPKKQSARPAKAGDQVELIRLGTKATVIQQNSDGTLQIQAGIMKLNVKQDEIYLLPDQDDGSNVRRFVEKTNRELRNLAIPTEVDLRGMTTDEAINALDNYLDSALLAKLGQVRIIHGKGTGVLRKAVQQHLKRHKRVKSCRLGTYGEGEDGVTIAELDL